MTLVSTVLFVHSLVIFAPWRPGKVTNIHLAMLPADDSMTWLARLPLMPRKIVAATRYPESRVNVRAGKGRFGVFPYLLLVLEERVVDVWMVVV